MVKRRIEGAGMMQREVMYDFASNEEIIAALKEWKGPERRWAEREAWCLEILRRSGVGEKDHDFDLRFAEDSAQHLARAWLRAWRRAQRTREKGISSP
jgi:hypothetical protein